MQPPTSAHMPANCSAQMAETGLDHWWQCRVHCVLQWRGQGGRGGLKVLVQLDQCGAAQDSVVSLPVPVDQLLQLCNYPSPCCHHCAHVLPGRD